MPSFPDLRKRRDIPCLAHLSIYRNVGPWARTVGVQGLEGLQPQIVLDLSLIRCRVGMNEIHVNSL